MMECGKKKMYYAVLKKLNGICVTFKKASDNTIGHMIHTKYGSYSLVNITSRPFRFSLHDTFISITDVDHMFCKPVTRFDD